MSQAITAGSPAATPASAVLAEAGAVQRDFHRFLRPLLTRLVAQLDVRLVRTVRDAVEALVSQRNRPQER